MFLSTKCHGKDLNWSSLCLGIIQGGKHLSPVDYGQGCSRAEPEAIHQLFSQGASQPSTFMPHGTHFMMGIGSMLRFK